MQSFDLKANKAQHFNAVARKADGTSGTIPQGDWSWNSSHPEFAVIHAVDGGGVGAYIFPVKPANLGSTVITVTGPNFSTSFMLNIIAADPDPNAADHFEFTGDFPVPLP